MPVDTHGDAFDEDTNHPPVAILKPAAAVFVDCRTFFSRERDAGRHVSSHVPLRPQGVVALRRIERVPQHDLYMQPAMPSPFLQERSSTAVQRRSLAPLAASARHSRSVGQRDRHSCH
jgi:hypothetical protein